RLQYARATTNSGNSDLLVSSTSEGGGVCRPLRRGPAQALITEYSPGAAIGWYRDRPEFEDVIGVSLGAPCLFRFRRKKGSRWERASIELQPRSAYLLRGPVRMDWQHSIPPVDKLRYSVTFRSLRESIEQ